MTKQVESVINLLLEHDCAGDLVDTRGRDEPESWQPASAAAPPSENLLSWRRRRFPEPPELEVFIPFLVRLCICETSSRQALRRLPGM